MKRFNKGNKKKKRSVSIIHGIQGAMNKWEGQQRTSLREDLGWTMKH